MKTKYYSPQLDRDLISPLYHAAKAEGIPMTKLASRWLAEKLSSLPQNGHSTASIK